MRQIQLMQQEKKEMTALFINLHVSLNETCNKTSELTFTM